MKKLIELAMGSVKRFNMWDFAIFKLCLFALGIIFGVYFTIFFLNNILIIWTIFIITYIWLMYITFWKYKG